MEGLCAGKADAASPSGLDTPPPAVPLNRSACASTSNPSTSSANTKANLDSLLARLSSIDSELDDLRLPRFALQRLQRSKPSTSALENANQQNQAAEEMAPVPSPLPANSDNETACAGPIEASENTDEAEAIFTSVMQRLAQLESKSVDVYPADPFETVAAPEMRKKRQQGDEGSLLAKEPAEMAETLRSFQGDGQCKPKATDALLESLLTQLSTVKTGDGGAAGVDSVINDPPSPLHRTNSKKQRLRSSSTSPTRPTRSACSTDVSSYSTSARDGVRRQQPEPPAMLGQHQHTLHGLIGHLQQLTQALQQATGVSMPSNATPPTTTTSFLSEGRADMQEVVHSALADLSSDLSGQPMAPPDRLSVDELMARADKLCGAAFDVADPTKTPLPPSQYTQDMTTLLEDDFLTADCEFGLDAWAQDICLPNDDLASLHLNTLPCDPDV